MHKIKGQSSKSSVLLCLNLVYLAGKDRLCNAVSCAQYMLLAKSQLISEQGFAH